MGTIYNRHEQGAMRLQLRSDASIPEKQLWRGLQKRQMLGYKFRRQYGIEGFVVDFYCPALRLAIELDGTSHDSALAKRYDAFRENLIKRHNIWFLRFTNDEVMGNTELVLAKIQQAIETATTPFPLLGEGRTMRGGGVFVLGNGITATSSPQDKLLT